MVDILGSQKAIGSAPRAALNPDAAEGQPDPLSVATARQALKGAVATVV
jgi:hypothetical protein